MGIRIQQLPAAIANQIAAGEVIERPASVVKELLENSLDAGATSITIEIGYGGLNQIKISDNGSGIVAEDLPLAIAAHATSKITKLDDLYAIGSMGFRGEALASIASIAKVTISSKPAHQDQAMMLKTQNAEFSIAPCARAVGTTVDVVDLFFNAPVRKRFLKGEKLEFQAIELVVKRFALSAPEIAITLKHNNKQTFTLPPALSEQAKLTRMSKIFGSAFMKDAVSLNVELTGMKLQGWLSGKGYQRSQNDRQWVYINQRMVKDKLINHALKQAYDGLLYPGRFPACLLYFTVNTAEVDVNVHPTKHEVRFQQPRLIHDFFTSQLSNALGINFARSPIEYDANSESSDVSRIAVREPHTYATANSNYSMEFNYITDTDGNAEISSSFGAKESNPVIPTCSEMETPWSILNNQYILVFLKQQPYVVDVVALQKHRVQKQLDQLVLPLKSRPLLVPVTYSLSRKLNQEIDVLKEYLSQLGLTIEHAKEERIVIRSVPVTIPYLDLGAFFDSISALDSIQLKQLMDLLSLCQVFDPKCLTKAERMEINQLLLHSQEQGIKQDTIYKALTIDDCRMLLHV